MGIVQVLLPLYALSLGYSILKISSLIALPVLFEGFTRLFGSALSDRYGERRILQGGYFLMVLTGVVLIFAEDFVLLLLAQTMAYFSRSTFWASIQSLASQMGGMSLGRRLGRLSASNYVGSLIGQGLGGVTAAFLGYHRSFFVLTALALLCVFLGFILPHVEPKPSGRSVWKITVGIGRLLCYRQAWLANSASFAAAIPFSLTVSIYPVYLAYLKYGDQWIGLAVSLRSVGPIIIGLFLSSMITVARQRGIYALGMAGLGVAIVGTALTDNFFLLGLCIAALGAAGIIMDLLNQVQATEWSTAGERTIAMASMGLGWNFCPVLTPILVAWLAEVQGFRIALLSAGTFFFLAAAGTRLWYRLLAPTVSMVSGEPGGVLAGNWKTSSRDDIAAGP